MKTLPPPAIDQEKLRGYRLARLRQQLDAADCAAALLFDSINLTYALGHVRYPVFQFHLPSAYAFVPQQGRVTLFEGYGAHTDAGHFDCQPSINLNYFHTGDRAAPSLAGFVAQIGALLRSAGGKRLAIDHAQAGIVLALQSAGIELVDAAPLVERARLIKSAEEIASIRHSIAVAELGMQRMREALRPGVTERELLALLEHTNVVHGGRWQEYEIVVSGPRTNPWLGEASMRAIEDGDLVAFDTGMSGPGGYCADISRTFHCGPSAPTADQRQLYRLAHDELQHNAALLRPGLAYRDFSERSWVPPAAFRQQRYPAIAHGIGLCDEHPIIVQPSHWSTEGIEGVFQPGMVISIESYLGAPGGSEGVKLEDEILITETGCEVLSRFPFEEALLR